jgi:chloramphenicol-sensitive protein RarD
MAQVKYYCEYCAKCAGLAARQLPATPRRKPTLAMTRGMIYAFTSYLVWGILPIYWKALGDLPALETTAHRVVWSALFVAVVLMLRRRWFWLREVVRTPLIAVTFVATAALIPVHWLIYIVAVSSGHIVETSLGHYINPLVNVVLAVLFLRERPRPLQWFAIGIAALGVTYLTVSYGHLPWIGLGMAFTFGFYALLRKTARLGSLEGMLLEMAILALPMAGYLIWRETTGVAAFGHASLTTSVLLALAGVVTALPLLLFSAGARAVSLTVLGLLQYIAPTISFVIGIVLYHEPFTSTQLAGFSVIWIALTVFTLEGMSQRRRLALPTVAR